ncbi:MAG: hypothetical protein DRN14_03860 [Thermoplasmata archaeon]|nr:MAG: hypothetical protein DRN14_03860 [Thermoplasmata archaeon]
MVGALAPFTIGLFEKENKMDFILNGQANGNVAQTLMMNNFDVNSLRPYIGEDGRSYITVIQNGAPTAVPVQNGTATLRKDDWKILDEAIVKAAKPRLRAVADLLGAGLRYNIPNGMGKTVLETETQSDISDAIISMDGLRESEGDRPVFELSNLPLPIIHKDFNFSARQVMASRNGGSPLDTTTAELAGRRVAEMAEKLLIGVASSYTYGGGTVYGLTNYTNRMTKTISNPTGGGWVPATTVSEVLQMRNQSQAAYHYGPWMLYCSPNWDVYMDDDYSSAKGDNTLRERLRKIEGIQDVRTLDYLTNYDLVLVQMTSDVVREVVGMDIATTQWESKGGMQLNFKVMAIMVPQLRADQNGNTGIVHASVA